MKQVTTVLLILTFAFLGMAQTSRVVVQTPSMEPTLHVDDVLIVDDTYYSTRPVQRFDIVSFKQPKADFKAVARVIALGGETVALKNGRVLINGKALRGRSKRNRVLIRTRIRAFRLPTSVRLASLKPSSFFLQIIAERVSIAGCGVLTRSARIG